MSCKLGTVNNEVAYLARLGSEAREQSRRTLLDQIRSETERNGFWEETYEWRISTYTTIRIAPVDAQRQAMVRSVGAVRYRDGLPHPPRSCAPSSIYASSNVF